jgi:uncharacterized protein
MELRFREPGGLEHRLEVKDLRIALRSSQIESVGYEASRRGLVVRFRSGGEYEYADVPPDVFMGILLTDSPGKFLAAKVKGKFEYRKLEGEVAA